MINFFRKRAQRKAIANHVAGATVIHESPFSDLKAPFKTKSLSEDFISKWVSPFYLERLLESNNYENAFLNVKDDINPEIVKQLLGSFDWRTRITGAYFASILDYEEFDDFIGINLLKSELSYAGEGYLVALALFNTDKTRNYILRYLDYYLMKPDLWFDQGDAMASIIWLDKKNGTNFIETKSYIEKWKSFTTDKPNWKLDHYIDFFNRRILKIEAIKNKIKNGM